MSRWNKQQKQQQANKQNATTTTPTGVTLTTDAERKGLSTFFTGVSDGKHYFDGQLVTQQTYSYLTSPSNAGRLWSGGGGEVL